MKDAALALTVMAGTDANDPATAEAHARKHDYVAALNPHALAGATVHRYIEAGASHLILRIGSLNAAAQLEQIAQTLLPELRRR